LCFVPRKIRTKKIGSREVVEKNAAMLFLRLILWHTVSDVPRERNAIGAITSCLRQVSARTWARKGAVFRPPVIRLPLGEKGAKRARRGGSGRFFGWFQRKSLS